MMFFLPKVLLPKEPMSTTPLYYAFGILAGSAYGFTPLQTVYRQVDTHFQRSASSWTENDLQEALNLIESQYQCDEQTTQKLQNKCKAQKQKAINRAQAADAKAKKKYEAELAKAAAKPDGLAVLGIFYEIQQGDNNQWSDLTAKLAQVKEPKGDPVIISSLSLKNFLPRHVQMYKLPCPKNFLLST